MDPSHRERIAACPRPIPCYRARRLAVSLNAGVAELVDALVLGTSIERCGGSSPFARTSFRPAHGVDAAKPIPLPEQEA